MVGARAVAVGTASFTHPHTAVRVAEGIRAFLETKGLASVSDWVGTLDA